MALTFEDVFGAELEEIRKRRLHQWRVEEIRRRHAEEAGDGEDVAYGKLEPPAGTKDQVIEGVPETIASKRDDADVPLVLNKILDDLESSRGAFLKTQEAKAACQAKSKTAEEPKPATNGAKADPEAPDGLPENMHYGLTGLALSGGGVRSSTFCLGAIQALAKWDVFPKIDYLSTVSGGGFIGSSISSLYADGSTEFPFDHKRGVPEGEPLRHLRNYANYLAPRGFSDYVKAPSLLLRGILVNFLIILPYVLLAAIATTLLAGPMVSEAVQSSSKLGPQIVERLPGDRSLAPGLGRILSGSFTVTSWLALTFVAVLVAYPVAQTTANLFGWSNWERRDNGNRLLAAGLTLTLVVAAVEAQPIAVYYAALLWSNPAIKGDIIDLDLLIGVFSAIAGLGASASGKLAPKANRLASKLALICIGLLGPIVLWLIYLMLTRWAICGPPKWTRTLADYAGYGPWPVEGQICFSQLFGRDPEQMMTSVVVAYAVVAAGIWIYGYVFINSNRNSLHAYYRDRLSRAYLFRRPHPDRIGGRNAEAEPEPEAAATQVVHNDKQLLQDLRRRKVRLDRPHGQKGSEKEPAQGSWQSLLSLFGRPEVTADPGPYVAPYHLINAAINVRRPRTNLVDEGDDPSKSKETGADLRGRKADFFLFSPDYIGSNVTCYCHTRDMHKFDHHVDLGTAMAISGAAAAPNMGTSTVRPLVFILTLLNVRLGYWLPNPRYVHQRYRPEPKTKAEPKAEPEATAETEANPEAKDKPAASEPKGSNGGSPRRWDRVNRSWKKLLYRAGLTYSVGPLYLLFEMFGLLNQGWPFINVSDGGHIENLGLYPLLQRRCRLIIVIDGGHDPEGEEGHSFSALATAIRYARIDHGIDVEIDPKTIGGKNGKHYAVGKISYGSGFPHGWLVYVKSSLTHDENPYIREYWLRNQTFPHETTGDQFFDETQFECYRALGYHAVEDFLRHGGSGVTADRGLNTLFHPGGKGARRKSRSKAAAAVAATSVAHTS